MPDGTWRSWLEGRRFTRRPGQRGPNGGPDPLETGHQLLKWSSTLGHRPPSRGERPGNGLRHETDLRDNYLDTHRYYSNTGYFLLSLIVERVEGRPLGSVLQSRIFEPLGMAQTRMADPEDIIPHRASGYWVDRMGAELRNRDATQT